MGPFNFSTAQFTYDKSNLTFCAEASDLGLKGFPGTIILTNTKTNNWTMWRLDKVQYDEWLEVIGAIYQVTPRFAWVYPKLRGHTLRIYND